MSTTDDEIRFSIQAMTRFLYIVTEEEDRIIQKIADFTKDNEATTYYFSTTRQLITMKEYLADWGTLDHKDGKVQGIHDTLIKIYKDNPERNTGYYVITDPQVQLTDAQVQRRVLDIAHQARNNDLVIKCLIFVSNRLVMPPKLARYFHVIHDQGPNDEEYLDLIQTLADKLGMAVPGAESVRHFRGLTHYETMAAFAQTMIVTQKTGGKPRIDPKVIADFKRRQLSKTDLLQYLDTSSAGFDKIGGLDRLKAWAERTKSTWTEEGRKFGLKAPRGLLLVGVWGCGKSQSVKALGNSWKLPVVQLETGRLRSSGVGESEANVYRVISLVEAIAPCILFVDEAEKNLAGTTSSAQLDAGTTGRMIGILSTWLQDTKADICLAMTANSVTNLPPELINRMSERFFFDLPSEDEIIEILKIHIARAGQDPAKMNLAELAEMADGMVGREIEQSIEAAMTSSFHASKDSLDHQILKAELESKPRISKTLGAEMDNLLKWVAWDEKAQNGVRARFASTPRPGRINGGR